jgi:hypothetical protein
MPTRYRKFVIRPMRIALESADLQVRERPWKDAEECRRYYLWVERRDAEADGLCAAR